VGGRSDAADESGFQVKRGRVEEVKEGVNEAGEVWFDVVAERLEERVEREEGGALRLGVTDSLRDELWVRTASADLKDKEEQRKRAGISVACCFAHSWPSESQRFSRATQAALRTETSASSKLL
jgi:hypothetical protein